MLGGVAELALDLGSTLGRSPASLCATAGRLLRATAGRLLSPAAGLLSPVAPRVGAAALGRPLLGARPLGISTMAGVAARYAGKKPHRADDGRVE